MSVSSCLGLLLALTLPPLSVGSPDEDYRQAMAKLYDGDLAGFYDKLAPDTYKRDLSSLLEQTKSLFNEADYLRLQALLDSFSQKASAQLLELHGGESDSASEGNFLNLDSYRVFQAATPHSLLEGLQKGWLGRSLKAGGPVSWSRQSVELIEEKGDRARLRVVSTDGGSGGEVKEVDFVRIEGKWIPSEIADAWDQRIAQVQSRLEEWKAAKRDDPAYILKGLDALSLQLDALVFLIPSFLRSAMEAGGRH